MFRDYVHESIEIPVSEVTAENIASGVLPVRIIQPGFNTSKTRNYTKNAVKDAVAIFEGAKQYANHATRTEEKERPERDIRDWVATLKNVRITKEGNAVGEAHIHSGWFKELVKGLQEAGTLNKLGVSINSIGKGAKQKIDGVETFLVESLVDHPFKSVDFVTEAGAGGQAGVQESTEVIDAYLMDFAKLKEVRPDLLKEAETEFENNKQTEVKERMTLEEELKEAQGKIATLETENTGLKAQITEAEQAKAKVQAQAAITEAISKSTLPQAAKEKLAEQFKEAVTADGITESIKAEESYLAKLTESGKVRNLGNTSTDSKKTREQVVESFTRMGLTKEQAEIAAR